MCFLGAGTAYLSLQPSWLRGHQCSGMTDLVLFSRSLRSILIVSCHLSPSLSRNGFDCKNK